MASTPLPRRLGTAFSAAFLLAALASGAAAAQLLDPGSWTGAGSHPDCPGAYALQPSASAQTAVMQQTVAPIAPGAYSFTGRSRLASGAASGTASLTWRNAGGSLGSSSTALSLGAAYASFSFNAVAPSNATSVLVRVSVTSSAGAVVCVDDLSLEGPPQPTATPTPSATPTATPSPSPTAAGGPPPTATNAPRPTLSPAVTAPAATATAAAAGMPSSQGAAGAAQGGPFFRNGGFEEGLEPWQKFGGVLSLVGAPLRSGAHAGALSSGTTSTKWAFQIVAIDASRACEFAGHLWADSGVREAYLRISWYASPDGSGEALSTTDSLTRTAGPSGGFVFLTTGPVLPPAGARSARLRAMLAPHSAAPATLYLDDLTFVELEPDAAGVGGTAGGETAAGGEATAAGPGPASAPPSGATAAPQQAAAAVAAAGPQAAGGGDAAAAAPAAAGRSLAWAAALLFLLGLGGGLLWRRGPALSALARLRLVGPLSPAYNRLSSLTQDSRTPLSPQSRPSGLVSVIAIDGPVASGKTAVGLRLARELGYRLVDTGMMYRAVTWLALRRGVDLADEEALTALAAEARIELGQPGPNGGPTITVDGTDVTAELRSPEVDRSVSLVSRVGGVRRAMVALQRRLAAEGRLIMLGRDIGTVVLPDAPVKVYLDASPAERARRRHRELAESGVERSEAEILAELEQRDEMDRQRHLSPLRPAEDALVIHTDDLSLDEVVARVRAAALAPERRP